VTRSRTFCVAREPPPDAVAVTGLLARWHDPAIGSSTPKPEPAPRLLRAKASAIDSTLQALIVGGYGLATWSRVRGGGADGDAVLSRSRRRADLLRLGGEGARLLGERYGTPGQRLVGLRTVDARSGEPVALPLTVALAATKVAAGVLSKRLTRARPLAEASASGREIGLAVQALRDECGEDVERFQRELAALYRERRPEQPSPSALELARPVLIGGALSLAHGRLRRALAPTVVVRARRGGRDQRP
jgi:hypothetical protein